MIVVYVETNFVLELALIQETHRPCEELLELCESNALTLALPAYSLVEPYEKLIRNKRARIRLEEQLHGELRQLERTAPYEKESQELKEQVANLLARSTHEEFQRLDATRARLLDSATIIPLTCEILCEASAQRARLDMSPQDAVVYASILSHLTAAQPVESSFINRNKKDFDVPDIVDELSSHGCKMLFDFHAGRNYAARCIAPQ